MKRFVISLTAAAALALAVPTQARAADITGTLDISGAVFYENLCIICGANADWTNAIIDFIPPTGGGVGLAGVTLVGATQYFAGIGLGFGDTGDIMDITNVFGEAGMYAPGLPATGVNFLDNFSEAGAAGLHFDATAIVPQVGPDCGVSAVSGCVASGVFKLTNSGTGVTVSFGLLGWFINGADSGFYSGLFTANFIGTNVAAMIASIKAGNNIICTSGFDGIGCAWSGNFQPFVTAVPEPATLLLFGSGAALLAAQRRRRAKNVKV